MEAQSDYVHIAYAFLHVRRQFCMLSRCLVTQFLRRSSGGSLLRVRCWSGRQESPTCVGLNLALSVWSGNSDNLKKKNYPSLTAFQHKDLLHFSLYVHSYIFCAISKRRFKKKPFSLNKYLQWSIRVSFSPTFFSHRGTNYASFLRWKKHQSSKEKKEKKGFFSFDFLLIRKKRKFCVFFFWKCTIFFSTRLVFPKKKNNPRKKRKEAFICGGGLKEDHL